MRLLSLIARRGLSALLTLLGVSVIVFAAAHLVPGGYQDVLLGPLGTPAARARIAAQFGLNQPLAVQYLKWIAAAVHGNFGTSLQSGQPVLHEIATRAPVSLEIALLATLFAMIVGIPGGILAGVSRRSWVRQGSRVSAAVAMSVPDFVLGSILLFVFSRYSLGLTVGEFIPFSTDPLANLKAIGLPVFTLAIYGMAIIVRTTRESARATMAEPYITAAVARGELPGTIVRRHVLRNGSIPVVTILLTFLAYMLGGDVIVEGLFSIPGLGQLLYKAIENRDYAVVQALVLLGAFVFITLNMAADVLYLYIDPRIGARRSVRHRR